MENDMPAQRKWRVLGTTEDAPVAGCEHCGRADLKRYVALEPVDGGAVVYYGTTCAARAEGVPAAVIRTEGATADRAAHEAAMAARGAEQRALEAAYSTWLQATYGVAQPAGLRALGLDPLAVHDEYVASLG